MSPGNSRMTDQIAGQTAGQQAEQTDRSGQYSDPRPALTERFPELATLGSQSDEQKAATFCTVLEALRRELDDEQHKDPQ